MIVNGFLDWANRSKPGPLNKVNGGVNPAQALFFHSAEGYEQGLWTVLATHQVSWHLTVLKDGRLFQHYPFSAQCWHATKANNFSIGMEHEGKAGEPLTPAQVATSRRVLVEVAAHYGWTPSRPTSPTDLNFTCWEHREVTRIGGSATLCPSGRIPWAEILAPGPAPTPQPTWEQVNKGLIAAAFVWSIGRPLTDVGEDDRKAVRWVVEQWK